MKRLTIVLAVVFLASSAFAAKICVDPGHGGSDPGATGNGLLEKNQNLLITNIFVQLMNDDSNNGNGGGAWTPIATRSTDITVSLSARTNYANAQQAERFMSTHCNAFNGSARGIETFCYGGGSSASFDLRNKVYEEACAMWPLPQRGVKTANFYVLVYTNMPAELHECGFIDNYYDALYIGDFWQCVGQSLSQLYALQRHYGIAPFNPN